MFDNDRVIIVGGGPVGLTLAWRLALADVPVALFEAEAAVPDQLRASTFHPPTLDMLAPDAVTDVLIANGRITPTWQVRWHETGERAEFDLTVLAADTDHPYRLQCHQAVLCRELARRIEALDPSIVRFGAEVMAVSQDADGVRVEMRGPSGGAETVAGRWLVGCDGARSIVRDAMGVTFEGATYPELTILATTHFPFERALEGLSGVNYIWMGAGTYSLLRLPELWRCSFHPRAGETPEDALEDDSIRAKVEEVAPGADPVDIPDKRIYRVHCRIAGAYRRGRMLLAGDAAHLNSPKGGMGMNGGIHDAFELAEALAAIHQRRGDQRRLDRYQRRRLPIARDDILAQSDANRARMAETDPEARRAALRTLQAIASDPARCRAFLLRSSMIEGLRRAAAVE